MDNQGGIHYTLTSTNQVMYVSSEGKQSVAVQKIETPNGITMSPDEKPLNISSDNCPILLMVGEHDNPERNQPSREKLNAAVVWTDEKIYSGGKHGCWNQLPWFNDMVVDMDTFFREQLK